MDLFDEKRIIYYLLINIQPSFWLQIIKLNAYFFQDISLITDGEQVDVGGILQPHHLPNIREKHWETVIIEITVFVKYVCGLIKISVNLIVKENNLLFLLIIVKCANDWFTLSSSSKLEGKGWLHLRACDICEKVNFKKKIFSFNCRNG